MEIRLRSYIGLFILSAWTGIWVQASAVDVPIRENKLTTSNLPGKCAPFLKERFVPHKLFKASNLQRTSHHYQSDGSGKLAIDTIFVCRAGTQSTSSILSKSLFVINQTVNIATAALVGSGFLGSWFASFIICKLQKLAVSSPMRNYSISNVGIVNRKWSLTIASCSVYFLMKLRGIIHTIVTRKALDSIIRASDLGVLLAIWAYSKIVDPVSGGLIGCGYVSLELFATVMSSGAASLLSELAAFRLTPLDSEGKLQSGPRMEFQSSSNLQVRESIAQALSSMSLLTSMPRYFLTLYLISSTILDLIDQRDGKLGELISWFKVGFHRNLNEIPLNLSIRLFAIHLANMIIKGVMSCFYL